MERKREGTRRWRAIALVAVGVAIGTTLTATPVYGHVGGTVGHLWKKHIRPLADQRYYSKIEVNAKVAGLEARVAALEAKLAAVSYDSTAKIFRFDGVNVQIVDGTGDTGGTPNGLGNLIVGHNEGGQPRTGSHNLVIGEFHTYTSYGGLVAGLGNSITGEAASVTGGSNNTASGFSASVSGGVNNKASGQLASVSGGNANAASGSSASVSGGQANTASGPWASVSGGDGNTASSFFASVGGGGNVASAPRQWVGGTLVVRTATVEVAGGAEGNGDYATKAVQQTCGAGELLLSGGGYWQPASGVDDDAKELPLIHSPVLDGKDGWSARGGNDTNINRTLVVQALCLGP